MGDGLEQNTLYVYKILITMKIFPHLKRTIFSVPQETPSRINPETRNGMAHISYLKTVYKSVWKAVREATCYSSTGSSLGQTVSGPADALRPADGGVARITQRDAALFSYSQIRRAVDKLHCGGHKALFTHCKNTDPHTFQRLKQ